MVVLDFNKSIDPKCGIDYKVINDIIVTPFWTPEFCKSVITVAEHYKDQFSKDIVWYGESSKDIGWNDIKFDDIDTSMTEYFVMQYKKYITPIISEVFTEASADIKGWFSPYIIRYNRTNQHADLHNDASYITLNIKLNNDYEGCDLIFPRQDLNTRDIPIGHAMIWPSTVSHPHYSTPLESGTKYSIVSWTWPPEWTVSGIPSN